MSIEYLPNLQAGDKIDIDKYQSRPEQRFRWEEFSSFLNQELANLAEQINHEFADFLESDGRIALLGPDQVSDQQLVEQQELALAGAHRSVSEWQASLENNPTTLAEKSLTIALSDVLGENFIVARAANYDDYNHGVDQVIIDKQTGEILCGFDEVLGHQGDDGGTKKESKLQRIMEKSGAQIKYGASKEDGRLVRRARQHIPAFYLSVSKAKLRHLLISQRTGGVERTTAEQQIFTKMLASLESQLLALGHRSGIDAKLLISMRATLGKFQEAQSATLAV